MHFCWVFAVAAVAACSSASSIELDELGRVSLAARCTRFVRCGLSPTIEACVAYFRIPPPDSFGQARDAGRLDFDGEQARRCEDALAAQSCDVTSRDLRVVSESCTKMFHGHVADGDACAFDQECASSRCDRGVCPDGVCCAGVCSSTRTGGNLGDACDKTSDCVGGLCDADRTCHALVAADGMCTADEECNYNTACVSPSPSIPGECKVLPHVGETCPYQRCADVGTTCDATQHCVALGLPGAPCTSHGDCSPLTECDLTSHVCIELPTLGMPCDLACGGESWCKFDDQGAGMCIEPLPNGTPCEDSYNCLSQNCRPGPIFDSCEDPSCP